MPGQRASISYWQIFRLMFVIFSLYTGGEVLYRLDGFKYYYASFPGFIPTLGLTTVFWSTVAFFAAMLIWLTSKAFNWYCIRIGWNIKVESGLFFLSIFVVLGSIVWILKRYMWHFGTTLQVKLIVLLSVSTISIFLTWLSRNRSERWISIVQKLITPLVRLFGFLLVVSVLLVAYHALW
jgi:hypothetical protein